MYFRYVYLIVLILLFSPSAFARQELSFSNQEIDVGVNIIRSVEAINLESGDEKELVAFGTDDNDQLVMVVLGSNSEGKHEVIARVALPDNVIAFDIGVEQENGQQDIYFLTKSHIKKYVRSGSNEQSQFINEQAITSLYITDKPAFIRKKSFVRDLNNDNIDDFVLPNFEQTHLWLSCDCKHRREQSIATAGQMIVNQESMFFRPTRLQFADTNNDQKTDVITLERGQLNVYLQKEDGLFEDEARVVEIDPKIDALDWGELREADGSGKDQSNLVHRQLDEVRDINGDNIPDLIVIYSQGSSVLKQANDFEFYFGDMKSGELSFSNQASTRISTGERLSDLQLVDLNNDKKMEALALSIDISIRDIIAALFSGKVKLDVLVFGINQEGQYESKPLVKDSVDLRFSLTSGQSGSPIARIEDINGDGLNDILLSDGTDKVKVRLGDNSSERAFARKPSSHALSLPQNPNTITHQDIDGDSKIDLIMYYGRQDDESLRNKIVIASAQ